MEKPSDNSLIRQGLRHMLNAMHNKEGLPKSNKDPSLLNAD
jgi:hypothetical protein